MSIYGITVDVARGFDVLRGEKLIESFERYEDARAYADAHRGCYIRYWAAKES